LGALWLVGEAQARQVRNTTRTSVNRNVGANRNVNRNVNVNRTVNPPSCSATVVGNVTYQQCGNTWYQPRYSGTQVTYVVVNPP
jgi:hypothetical protein